MSGKQRSNVRFDFGRNWQRFLRVLNEERIAASERAICDRLKVGTLEGLSFLDVGSGSGLASLAAMRLHARRVHSFDNDPNSVACTNELRRRYFLEAPNWTVELASVLDADY